MTTESRCRDVAKQLLNQEFLRIYSDDDADGIAAAGVLTAALDRAGVPFHLTLERLDAGEFSKLDAHDSLLLMDQGSGELDQLAGHGGEVFVLDHHVVNGRAPRALHVNPHLEGESGTDACCTSTLALLTALHMDPVNSALAPIAMAGIVGDRQHVPQLVGSNASVAKRAINGGSLEAHRGPPFPPEVALERAIAKSVDPYLKELTGRARRARSWLQELGLPPEAPLSRLDRDQLQRLTSALVAQLLEQGVEPRLAEQAAGQRFEGELFGTPVRASTLTALFNACAREDRPGLGVAIAHGDQRAFREARELVEAYDEDILRGLLQLERNPPEALEHIQVFDAVDPDLMGAHCGIGMAYLFDQSRPCLALKVSDDGRHKVSARATGRLVDAGVDLAEAMRVAAGEAGGGGGGHPIAAGAAFPKENRETFLERVDAIVGEQLGRG